MNSCKEACIKATNEHINELKKHGMETSHYKTVERSLMITLYEFCKNEGIGGFPEEVPGVEFVETIKECLRYYEPNKGDFLSYFMTAFRRRLKQKEGKEKFEAMHSGIKMSKDHREKIKKHLDNPEEEVHGITKIDIDFYEGDTRILVGEEGEDFYNDLFGEISAENMVIDKERLMTYMDAIEGAYIKTKDKNKELISVIITARIIPLLHEMEDILVYAKSKTFFSTLVNEWYLEKGESPTAREIAEIFDKHESSISRTKAAFIQSIEKKFKNM